MPVIAIGEGDGLLLRINGDNAAIAQRDAVGVVSQDLTVEVRRRDHRAVERRILSNR